MRRRHDTTTSGGGGGNIFIVIIIIIIIIINNNTTTTQHNNNRRIDAEHDDYIARIKELEEHVSTLEAALQVKPYHADISRWMCSVT